MGLFCLPQLLSKEENTAFELVLQSEIGESRKEGGYLRKGHLLLGYGNPTGVGG